jgi:hypothetical protein
LAKRRADVVAAVAARIACARESFMILDVWKKINKEEFC